jgi:hypothetical protein
MVGLFYLRAPPRAIIPRNFMLCFCLPSDALLFAFLFSLFVLHALYLLLFHDVCILCALLLTTHMERIIPGECLSLPPPLHPIIIDTLSLHILTKWGVPCAAM